MAEPARSHHKLHRGQRVQDAVSTPVDGTLTLEQWKRLRAEPPAEVHVVRHHAPGKSVGE